MPQHPSECAELLLALSEAPSRRFPDVAAAVVEGLDRIGASDSETNASDWETEEEERRLGPQFLENLLQALQHFSGGGLGSAAAENGSARRKTPPVSLRSLRFA